MRKDCIEDHQKRKNEFLYRVFIYMKYILLKFILEFKNVLFYILFLKLKLFDEIFVEFLLVF